VEIPISEVEISSLKWKRKIDPKNVAELSKSIGEFGVLHPIIVRKIDGGYELLAGEHRLQAAKRAKKKTITATVLKVNDTDAALISYEENLRRFQPDSFEFAEGLAEYRDLYEKKHGKIRRGPKQRPAPRKKKAAGRKKDKAKPKTPPTEPISDTVAEIEPEPEPTPEPEESFDKGVAVRLGVSERSVRRNTTRIKKLSPKAKEAWKDKRITASQADELVKLPPKKQDELLPELEGQTKTETQIRVQVANQDKRMARLARLLKEAAPLAEKLNVKVEAAHRIMEEEGVKKIGGLGALRLGLELSTLRRTLNDLAAMVGTDEGERHGQG
jgi:hypothetical protein